MKLSELKGSSELPQLYEKMEGVLCSGTHTQGRDYTRENREAREISKELHKLIDECVKLNGLDPTKTWKLFPPTLLDNGEFTLRDW